MTRLATTLLMMIFEGRWICVLGREGIMYSIGVCYIDMGLVRVGGSASQWYEKGG